ncbi:MAG: hypothetical protein WB608_24890 [Terracidiphilus sp.]
MTRWARFVSFLILLSALAFKVAGAAAASQSGSSQAGSTATSSITLPPGTKVELAIIVPVWSQKARPGDPVYTQTYFPVTAGGSVAIPAGTWVQGRIESIKLPTRKVRLAELQVLFTKIILANGYTLSLPGSPDQSLDAAHEAGAGGSAMSAATITVEATSSNDLLLDNGAQIEMTLAAPLTMDASQIASAILVSRPPEPGKFKSATLCRPTQGSPGTPGSPDTVIPGSPGTPSITIPGAPGMPDTVIPGTPATPDTVIPGSPGFPGTPGSVCPAAPIVVSSVPVALQPKSIGSAPPSAR